MPRPIPFAQRTELKPIAARTVSRSGKPAHDEVSLAGQDGAALAKVLGQSKSYGVRIMAELVGNAVRRYKGFGPLLTDPETQKLSLALAAVNSSADLLGRSRAAELSERARTWKGSDDAPPDAPFHSFAEAPPGILATPEDALAYFMSRRPVLSIDPNRYGATQRRAAFTLARSTNAYLTQRIQRIIGESLRTFKSTGDAQKAIADALAQAGVSPRNPQYAEMVFRTNVMDSFQQGHFEEGHAREEDFPVWQYLGIDDERAGKDHKPHFDKYFPRTASFNEVRGDRPFNCRCCPKWVDAATWERLKAGGAREETKW